MFRIPELLFHIGRPLIGVAAHPVLTAGTAAGFGGLQSGPVLQNQNGLQLPPALRPLGGICGGGRRQAGLFRRCPPVVVIAGPALDPHCGGQGGESFAVSHDAAQAQFYNYHHNGKSFVIVTDTGTISDNVAGIIRDADGYLFECNYDTDMLMNGDYSYYTKLRIQSDTGHLSNVEGTEVLMDVMGPKTKHIFLAHRSHHNNTKELQRLTVASMMKNNGLGVGKSFQLHGTDVEKPSDLYTL